MKTTYWLVAAAAVAAAGVTIYTRLAAKDPPLPKVPLVAEAPAVPQLALPPVVSPPDEPLVLPAVPDTPATPLPDALPVSPASGNDPVVPPVPPTGLPVPPPGLMDPLAPPMPLVPIAPPLPVPPLVPPTPADVIPPALVAPPVKPALVPPAPPTPAILPGPAVLQAPVTATAPGTASQPETLAVIGKFAVLKGDKLVEGSVSLSGNLVLVRQGALDRPFPKSQVQFVAASRDEVYRFMLAKVSATDAAARLWVAKWCMFSGLREQALTEAREVRKLEPMNRAAADLVRSLELSLQQFPPEGAPKMTAPSVPTFSTELKTPVAPVSPAVLDPEPDVTAEAALAFGTRVQPFLANQCIECHAKPDFVGKFKLVRVDPADAGPQATRTNLRAVVGQLRKDDPAASPLLLKTLIAHGGQKFPGAINRQAPAYQALEAWVVCAVGTPVVPALVLPTPPAPVLAPVPPAVDPLLAPLPPPGVPLPKPVAPAIPPADPFGPVLPPTPPVAIPPIPPAISAPKLPSPVTSANGTQFGSSIPPKPPVTGPAGGDEFDPAGFNQLPRK